MDTFDDKDAGHHLHPCQSRWMSHWRRLLSTVSSGQCRFSRCDGGKESSDNKQERMLVQIAEPGQTSRINMELVPSDISESRNARRCEHDDLQGKFHVSNYGKAVTLECLEKGAEITNEELDLMVHLSFAKSEEKFQAAVASFKEEVISRSVERAGFLAAESSLNKRVSNTSITESLDGEHYYHDEQPSNLNSTSCYDGLSCQPYNRWVKRLRLSASGTFGLGTKTSQTGAALSGERVNVLFHKHRSSQSRFSKCTDQGQKESDKNHLISNWGSSTLESLRTHQDLPLSHPWIQRWCQHQTAIQRRKQVEPVSEPRNLKAAMDDCQRKKLPSISAMALMGKATNCFRPCQFKKKGSVIVWHTESFR